MFDGLNINVTSRLDARVPQHTLRVFQGSILLPVRSRSPAHRWKVTSRSPLLVRPKEHRPMRLSLAAFLCSLAVLPPFDLQMKRAPACRM
jgi:hypothetical protein